MKKINGFSLVELLIVVAGLAVVAVVSMQIQKNQNKTSAKGNFDSDVLLTTNEINAILSDPTKCFSTLGGKNALSEVTGIDSINTNKYYSVASGAAPASGYGNSNFKITSYVLSATAADVSANNSFLLINFENKQILKGATGPNTITKKINLYVEVDANKNITKCRSLSSSSTDIWSRGSGSDIFYNGGKTGIGTISPAVILDIAGEIKVANTGAICNSSIEGSIRYNSTSKVMEFCNGTAWSNIGGNISGTQVNMYQCPGPVSLGGGAWGFYGCQNQITNTPYCYEVEWPTHATFTCTYVGKMTLSP